MGCDIHIFAEIKDSEGWKKVGKVFENPYYDPDRPNKIDDDGYEWNAPLIDEPYSGRNYDLFGILANVRNGSGFAGTKIRGSQHNDDVMHMKVSYRRAMWGSAPAQDKTCRRLPQAPQPSSHQQYRGSRWRPRWGA